MNIKRFTFAFLSIFVALEIGASALIKVHAYDDKLVGIELEKTNVSYEVIKTKENKVINNNSYDYDDSVDTIKDYMDYYIFLPEENEERGIKNEALKEVTMDDRELLYRLVTREAGNQDTYGMRLIVDVVLNRVNDDRFPGNIKDVLYSPGQFDGAKDLSLVTPYDTCKHAVDMELNCDLEGSRLDYESIYFARSPHTKNHYKHGDHYFSH